MKRARKHLAPFALLGFIAAAPAQAGQPASPAGDLALSSQAMATADLAGHAGGTRGFDLGLVVDDIQLNAPTTSATVAGNAISGLDTGDAVHNSMSDIHGFGNTMVVNTGVLTMANSVNVNVTLDMAR